MALSESSANHHFPTKRLVLNSRGRQLAERLRAARAFVAADGQIYTVGPCGFVPRSARIDPARRRHAA